MLDGDLLAYSSMAISLFSGLFLVAIHIQRKVLTPNDCTTLDELAARIHAFGQRYSALDKPFA